MRFFLVISIWVVIVGGLWGYVSQRDAKRALIVAPTANNLAVDGLFFIELTPTFSLEEDPFALNTSDSAPSSITVKLNGVEIPLEADDVMRGKAIRLGHIPGMLSGQNEIYINASPPMSENMLEHGVRVKLFEDNDLVVDETVWATQGALVSGAVSFSYNGKEEAAHDH